MMSTIFKSGPRNSERIKAAEGFIARLVQRASAAYRERRRRRMTRELLVLHDGLLDDLGVSRAQLALAARPRLPADVRAWIERRR